MENNVLSWEHAIAMGMDPQSYPYEGDGVPMGECRAILDFKIWAKHVLGISCYFKEMDSGSRFQLTVYIDKKYGIYFIRDVPVNFSSCAVGVEYLVRVGKDNRGRAKFLYAEKCS